MAERHKEFASLGALLTESEKQTLDSERNKQNASKQIGTGLTAVITLDKKMRRGKVVTLISGIALSTEKLEALAQELRKACGAGGTLKERVIEIQGDHSKKLREALTGRGFTIKMIGIK